MERKTVVLVGFVNKGHIPSGGEIVKNQLFTKRFGDLGLKVIVVDFYGWRKHPWTFLELLWYILFKPNAAFIFSTSLSNSYPLMRWMYKFGIRRHCIHWVIGGSVHKKIEEGIYDVKILNSMKWTIVQIPSMVTSLKHSGVENVIYVPNSKPISYIPSKKYDYDKFHFVFLSAIKKEKGCDYIFESVKMLNEMGLKDKYDVSFYGTIFPEYRRRFFEQIDDYENVFYRGVLNLRENKGYDELSGYQVMLFPTYWRGEGFAGVFIDAFIAGLPIIASDWGHNMQFLDNGKNSIFVETHNVTALAKVMKRFIEGEFDLYSMSDYSRSQAAKYDINNVITNDLLRTIGLL